jgi:hypothetical protein
VRQPLDYPLGSRFPAHTSNDTKTVLLVGCAMIAIVAAIIVNSNEPMTVVGFLH